MYFILFVQFFLLFVFFLGFEKGSTGVAIGGLLLIQASIVTLLIFQLDQKHKKDKGRLQDLERFQKAFNSYSSLTNSNVSELNRLQQSLPQLQCEVKSLSQEFSRIKARLAPTPASTLQDLISHFKNLPGEDELFFDRAASVRRLHHALSTVQSELILVNPWPAEHLNTLIEHHDHSRPSIRQLLQRGV